MIADGHHGDDLLAVQEEGQGALRDHGRLDPPPAFIDPLDTAGQARILRVGPDKKLIERGLIELRPPLAQADYFRAFRIIHRPRTPTTTCGCRRHPGTGCGSFSYILPPLSVRPVASHRGPGIRKRSGPDHRPAPPQIPLRQASATSFANG